MTNVHQRYCKRILKQYGKHIKAHEDRMSIQNCLELQIPFFVKRGTRTLTSHDMIVKGASE